MVKKKEETALAVQETGALEVAPAWMQQYAGDGAEDIKQDLIGKSILKCVQKTSKEFDDKLAEVGDFVDSVTKENHGNEVSVVVVKMEEQWRTFTDKNQLERISNDGVFWDNGTPVEGDDKWNKHHIDFFVLLLDEEGNLKSELPLIISLAKTSFKAGKNWHTQIAKFVMANREPIFGRSYTVYTETTKNEKGTFAVIKTKLNSGFTNEAVANVASKVREMVKGISAKVETAEDAGAGEVD